MAMFWNVARSSLVDIGRSFTYVYCFHHQGDANDEGGKHLWDIGQYLPGYTAK
jgi:hypothetical protein